MLSKLSVLRVFRVSLHQIRRAGDLATLENFEKLRKLCCVPEASEKTAKLEDEIRPRREELDHSERDCFDCANERLAKVFQIKCKTAMIVGDPMGLGIETADNLLKAGAQRVIVVDGNPCYGNEVVKKLCSAYGNDKAIFLRANISDSQSIEKGFKEVIKNFAPLDIYVNVSEVYNETPNYWDQMVRTNLTGGVRGTILAYNYMSDNSKDECDGSVIVNLSSYGSIANVPSMPLYSAAANGIVGLTTSFGQDFHYTRTKIRFVSVCASCTDSGLLKNMNRYHYDMQWAGHSNAAMKCCTKQSVKVVARGIVSAITHGLNGFVYVIKDGKYYRYVMPDYVKFLRQEAILW